MADVVNLRTARKRALRNKRADGAAQSRIVHGRSKAEHALTAARLAKTEQRLDAHRIDKEGA